MTELVSTPKGNFRITHKYPRGVMGSQPMVRAVHVDTGAEVVAQLSNLRRGSFKLGDHKNLRVKQGEVVDTPKGKVLVLARYPGGEGNPRVDVKVLATGTVLNVQVNNLRKGKFQDPLEVTVYGVGYLGTTLRIPERRERSLLRRAYDLWANMLKRCYHPTQGRWYGNVEVARPWHSFATFWKTLPEVPGYMEWARGEPRDLDKDLRVPGSRVYSRETCQFIPPAMNRGRKKAALAEH